MKDLFLRKICQSTSSVQRGKGKKKEERASDVRDCNQGKKRNRRPLASSRPIKIPKKIRLGTKIQKSRGNALAGLGKKKAAI